MNDLEYFKKLSEFVSPRIGKGYGETMATARALHYLYGGAFQTTYAFLLHVKAGFGVSLHQGPIEKRVAHLLEYLKASEEDSIISDSREYFGERFVFNDKLHTFRITQDEREVMLSLIEGHLGDDLKLPRTSESLRVAGSLVRKLRNGETK